MKKKTIAAMSVMLPAAALYAVSLYFFNYGIARHDGKDFWSDGEVSGEDSEIINEGMRWIRSQECETVRIVSLDSLKLCAHIIDCDNPKGVIIMMHGFRSNGIHDFSCAAKHFHDLGFVLLIPDQRAHGASGGKYLTYGIREKDDCRLWAEYADKRYGSKLPIILHGISMGASTVMLASGEELPASVCGIIADCGYTSPKDIFRHVIKKQFHVPPGIFLASVQLIVQRRAGYRFDEGNVPEALAKNKRPLLLLHGGSDTFVPPEMTETNLAAAKNCDATVVRVPGAEHGRSYLVDTEGCNKALETFLVKCRKYYENNGNHAI